MKSKRILICIPGALYAFLFSVSVIGCLITGWSLSIPSIGSLMCWCGLLSLLFSLLLCFPYGGWGILFLSVCGGFVLWQDGALWKQIQSLAHTMSTHYHNVYNWPVLGTPITQESELVLILFAGLTVISVSWCICRRKHIVFALPSVVLPMILCLITTDTLPEERYLYLLMLGMVLLLVTDWVRRKNPRQFIFLTLWTVIPVAVALSLLFTLNPQDEYVNHAARLQKEAVEWFQQVASAAESVINGNVTENLAAKKLNLRNVGPKNDLSYTVMRLTSPYDGTVYLRGRDYDIYTGTMWEASDDRKEIFPSGSEVSGTLRIVTYGVRNFLYTPYYAVDPILLVGGFTENHENRNEYSYPVSRIPDQFSGETSDISGYMSLPSETYEWARALVTNILPAAESMPEESVVQAIMEYVRTCASYDLSTSAMGSDDDDFARWFLMESDTGYCIHFATAATVLLRAAGIPARYVEGYVVNCQAEGEILVSNQEAHAWTEYYDSSTAVWRVLEATPSEAIRTGVLAEVENEETEPVETETTENPLNQPLGEQIHGHDVVGTGGSSGDMSGNTNKGNTDGAGEVLPKSVFRPLDWMKPLVWIILGVVVIPVQGKIRVVIKRKQWDTGTPNEMALVRWKYVRQLARLTKTKLPEELEEMALKAKFSQHILTVAELDRFTFWRKKILQTIEQMPWYRRYFFCWIFAVG